MKPALSQFLRSVRGSVRDLAPIVGVIAFFQIFVLNLPLPDAAELIAGSVSVVLGLTLFVYGLEMGLFPIGESMAGAFARKGSLFWLLAFAFALGFGTTVAEPALIAVAAEAADVMADGDVIDDAEASRERYALGLRLTVAVAPRPFRSSPCPNP